MRRGEIWWASLPPPTGSGPGYRHPVVVIQTNEFNESRIKTAVGVLITSNLRLAGAPGNVRCGREETGLPKDSVVNVSQVVTVDKELFIERVGTIPTHLLTQVEEGLRRVLGL
ncbi:MAG TPA: type II toxin-antitoxin system PemK/MazF family toxin [Terriglobia bacterium]|nr:type II toxin-antitoxin system PemK/MazF family toxin [Terriglobia bacterium]